MSLNTHFLFYQKEKPDCSIVDGEIASVRGRAIRSAPALRHLAISQINKNANWLRMYVQEKNHGGICFCLTVINLIRFELEQLTYVLLIRWQSIGRRIIITGVELTEIRIADLRFYSF